MQKKFKFGDFFGGLLRQQLFIPVAALLILAIFNFVDNKYFFIAALVFSLPIAPWLKKKFSRNVIANIIYPVLLIGVFVLSVSYIIKGSYNPFIYFNF